MAKAKKIPEGLFASFAHMDKDAMIDFLRRKGFAITGSWDDLWEESHAFAKTIAGETRINVLEDIYNHIDKNMPKGKTRNAMAGEIAKALADKGWYFDRTRGSYQLDHNALLGDVLPIDEKAIKALEKRALKQSTRRLKLIMRQNTQSAYMAATYQRQIENSDNRPYWQYLAVIDGSTRDSHRALHNKVFRAVDPIWDKVYPPNGFNCRCRVSALSERDMKRLGLSVNQFETTAHELPKRNADGSPRYQYEIKEKTTDAEAYRIATGKSSGDLLDDAPTPKQMKLDAGFAYNAGKVQASPFIPRPGSITAENEHLLKRVADNDKILPTGLTAEEYADAFLAEFDIKRGEVKNFIDVTGEVMPISEELLTARKADQTPYLKADKAGRGQYMKLLAQTFKDPDEVWLSWEKERGAWQLKRHYLRVIDVGDNLFSLGVFKWEKGAWYGATIFQPHPTKGQDLLVDYLHDKRKGVRLYKRKSGSE